MQNQKIHKVTIRDSEFQEIYDTLTERAEELGALRDEYFYETGELELGFSMADRAAILDAVARRLAASHDRKPKPLPKRKPFNQDDA